MAHELIRTALSGGSLLATLGVGVLVLRQGQLHYRRQHAADFIARFNSEPMVRLRGRVDRWVESGEKPIDLHTRLTTDRDGGAVAVDQDLRVFANFFQELGTAVARKVADKRYTWDNSAPLARRYWIALGPYIEFLRQKDKRPTLYADFERVARELDDGDRRVHPEHYRSRLPFGRVYIFAYGSLINRASMEKTLGTDRRRCVPGTLTDFALNWKAEAGVRVRRGGGEGDEVEVAAAFLNVAEKRGGRVDGVLIEVGIDELATMLDVRERPYRRLRVTGHIEADIGSDEVFVYSSDMTDNSDGAVILEGYLQLLRTAAESGGHLAHAGLAGFVRELPLGTVAGEYVFRDTAQSLAAGRN